MDYPSTFSIIAFDEKTKEHGVAVQSKFLACASIVPWSRAGVGAVATQARANYGFGPRGLDLLAAGKTAQEVLDALIASDDDRELRQLAVIDRHGQTAAFTGSACLYWAGHLAGEAVSCQGNILAGPGVVPAMADAYAAAHGDLAEKLLTALEAGEAAGGDRRGRQSAGILVTKEGSGFGGLCDRYIDLRVDDHVAPIQELRRLVSLHRVTFASAHADKHYRADSVVRDHVAGWLDDLSVHPDPVDSPRQENAMTRLAKWDGLAPIPSEWISGETILRLKNAVQPYVTSKLEAQETQLRKLEAARKAL